MNRSLHEQPVAGPSERANRRSLDSRRNGRCRTRHDGEAEQRGRSGASCRTAGATKPARTCRVAQVEPRLQTRAAKHAPSSRAKRSASSRRGRSCGRRRSGSNSTARPIGRASSDGAASTAEEPARQRRNGAPICKALTSTTAMPERRRGSLGTPPKSARLRFADAGTYLPSAFAHGAAERVRRRHVHPRTTAGAGADPFRRRAALRQPRVPRSHRLRHASRNSQAAGGLGELFGEPYPREDGDDEAEAGRKLRLRTSEGLEYPVEAFLQSVPWGERQGAAPVAAPQLAPAGQLSGVAADAASQPTRCSRRASRRCGRSSTRRPTASC